MNEITRLLFEMGSGTLVLLLGIVAQRQASRRSSREFESDHVTFESLGLQLDALDVAIESQAEPAVRMRREDEEYQATIRRVLLDIDDLAAQTDPPTHQIEEAMRLAPTAFTPLSETLVDPELTPGERARVFLSTGQTFDGNGWAFSFLIAGNHGRQQITISSGTSQDDIISAIRQFSHQTGVLPLQDPVNPHWIRLVSRRRGPDRFVGAGLVHGWVHNAFYDENRSNPSNRQVDFGA